MRCWRKSAGPGLSARIAAAINMKTGRKSRTVVAATIKSNARLRRLIAGAATSVAASSIRADASPRRKASTNIWPSNPAMPEQRHNPAAGAVFQAPLAFLRWREMGSMVEVRTTNRCRCSAPPLWHIGAVRGMHMGHRECRRGLSGWRRANASKRWVDGGGRLRTLHGVGRRAWQERHAIYARQVALLCARNCRDCATISQACDPPAAGGPSVLAMIFVATFGQRQPLDGQVEREA